MNKYQSFFQVFKKIPARISRLRENRAKSGKEYDFPLLEVIEIIREKRRYIIFAKMPDSSRTFKFSLHKDGEVRGFLHSKEMSLTDTAQKILRNKFALYVHKAPPYFISAV